MRKIKAGFVGFGEVNTPPEFIVTRCRTAADELKKRGVELLETPPVSDDPEGKNAARAVRDLSAGDFDALVVCVAGWIPTWAVIKTIEPFKHKPMLLWGLSGWRADNHFVTTADQAGTTALRKPMEDMGFTFKYLVNYFRTLGRMRLHFLKFGGLETSGLAQNCVIYGNLAKIVHWSGLNYIYTESTIQIRIFRMFSNLINKNSYTLACSADMVTGTVIAAFDHTCNSGNNRILNIYDFFVSFLNLKFKVMLGAFKIIQIFLMACYVPQLHKVTNTPFFIHD